MGHRMAFDDKQLDDLSPAALRLLDAKDPLAAFRGDHVLPDDRIYLDGNSLGAQPKGTKARLLKVIDEEWGGDLIGGWSSAGWYDMPRTLGDRVGRLIGAAPGQTVVTDSISVNLFKLVCAALELQDGRRELVSEAGNFPSDLYIIQGIARVFPDVTIRLIGRDGSFDDLVGDRTAAVILTGVDFRTGERKDMAAITKAAQAAGAMMVWDLAHSAGAFPVALDGCGADFAVGCTYKYLNAGPGAPAFLYVAERHQHCARTPISGWFGHKDPFAFDPDFVPAEDIGQFLCGTPPILGMAALDASLDIWDQADLDQVRAKSVALTELFIRLVDNLDPDYGLSVVSPREADRRGSQVSLRHESGLAIMRALIARGVVGDFRAPDILRFGFTPLTLSYAEVGRAVEILDDIMRTGAWTAMAADRGAGVT